MVLALPEHVQDRVPLVAVRALAIFGDLCSFEPIFGIDGASKNGAKCVVFFGSCFKSVLVSWLRVARIST